MFYVACATNVFKNEIYFLSVAICPNLHSFGRAACPPAHAAGTICPARPVWYRVQTGAACPASERMCRRVAQSALHLARPAPLPVLCSLSGCAGGWGLHRRGIQGAPGVGWVDSLRRKNSKKAFSAFLLPTPTTPSQNETHQIVQVSKNSKKYKKTPHEA